MTPYRPVPFDIQAHKLEMAQIDEAARKERPEEPRWFDARGQEVDLDDIDKEYALNILMMVHARRIIAEYTADEMRADPLIQKLRDVVLHGREPNLIDRRRGDLYNRAMRKMGLPYRARQR